MHSTNKGGKVMKLYLIYQNYMLLWLKLNVSVKLFLKIKNFTIQYLNKNIFQNYLTSLLITYNVKNN